nr:hypothetical protein Iba_scaffold14366CG0020 [Ipomoea batatas]
MRIFSAFTEDMHPTSHFYICSDKETRLVYKGHFISLAILKALTFNSCTFGTIKIKGKSSVANFLANEPISWQLITAC